MFTRQGNASPCGADDHLSAIHELDLLKDLRRRCQSPQTTSITELNLDIAIKDLSQLHYTTVRDTYHLSGIHNPSRIDGVFQQLHGVYRAVTQLGPQVLLRQINTMQRIGEGTRPLAYAYPMLTLKMVSY